MNDGTQFPSLLRLSVLPYCASSQASEVQSSSICESHPVDFIVKKIRKSVKTIRSKIARLWLAWSHGGGTFRANIIPPWEDYSSGDIFRRRRSALASPRRRHHRVMRYDSGTARHSWRAANTDAGYRHCELSTDRL